MASSDPRCSGSCPLFGHGFDGAPAVSSALETSAPDSAAEAVELPLRERATAALASSRSPKRKRRLRFKARALPSQSRSPVGPPSRSPAEPAEKSPFAAGSRDVTAGVIAKSDSLAALKDMYRELMRTVPLPPDLETASRRVCYDACRGMVRRMLFTAKRKGIAWPPGCDDSAFADCDSFRLFRKAYDAASSEFKRTAAVWLVSVTDLPAHLVQELSADKAKGRGNRSLLLTYVQGDEPWHGVECAAGQPLSQVCALVLDDAAFQRTRDSFEEFRLRLVDATMAANYAACAELCGQSWDELGQIRVHFHLFLLRQDRSLRPVCPEALTWNKRTPHSAGTPQLPAHGRGRTTIWRGYFYCQAEKIGGLWSVADKRPWSGYPVHSQWIVQLVSAGKLDPDVGKAYCSRCVSGASRHIADIDAYMRVNRKRELEVYQRAVEEKLRKTMRPQREIPQVVAWCHTFDHVADRYKSLVLDGPSQCGKTRYARSLVPDGREVFEVSCASGTLPSLREFDWNRHGLILFEECTPEIMARERKLFQCPNIAVQMGASSTNCFMYEIFVHRVRLVCTCNHWKSRLDLMPAGDAAWITANIVYVAVNAPLWVQEP
jgi:hypothetical protein